MNKSSQKIDYQIENMTEDQNDDHKYYSKVRNAQKHNA